MEKSCFEIRRDGLICAILVVVTIGLYWQTRAHDFVYYDTDVIVINNPHVNSGLSFKNLRWALTTDYFAYWHPTTWVSHMIDCQLFGLKPAGHHMHNVLLHALNAGLLFLVLFRLTGARWPAVFVAAVFAVHPLRVESVAWVAERKDVLSGFYAILALGAYAWYAEKPSVKRYAPVLLFTAMGLMAKPMLVTLPFVFLLLDYWPLRRIGTVKGDLRNALKELGRLTLEKAPVFALIIGVSIATLLMQAQREGTALAGLAALPLEARMGNALVSYVSYLSKSVWPTGLSAIYPHPGTNLPFWKAAVAGLILAGITAFALWKLTSHRYVAVGWFWFLGTLVPVIGLTQAGSQAMADRFTYFPLIGILIVVAWGVRDFVQGRGQGMRRGFFALSGFVVVILMGLTWTQTRHWRDTVSLFTHAIEVDQDNHIAHTNLGHAFEIEGEKERAASHYQQAFALRPSSFRVHARLAALLMDTGDGDRAIFHYAEAVKSHSENATLRNNFGVALAGMGRVRDALEQFEEAVRLKPDYAKARTNLDRARHEVH